MSRLCYASDVGLFGVYWSLRVYCLISASDSSPNAGDSFKLSATAENESDEGAAATKLTSRLCELGGGKATHTVLKCYRRANEGQLRRALLGHPLVNQIGGNNMREPNRPDPVS